MHCTAAKARAACVAAGSTACSTTLDGKAQVLKLCSDASLKPVGVDGTCVKSITYNSVAAALKYKGVALPAVTSSKC